jgi:lipopolysaccharide transport system ATP-binding protein
MSDVAIHVESLSKFYRIGERQRYKTLRDSLSNALYAPFHAAASLLNSHNGYQSTGSNGLSNNEFWALKDVSFDIKKGEVIGIIGRNGAGKSTLLKILSRITKPTQGYVRINGRVGSLLEVGTGFHPELTGRENIYLNGAIIGMRKKEIDRKFDEIVAFAEIAKFVDTPVKFYSSGMYIRLAFAVAAHLEPEILLVDEVLAVGDLAFQNKCLDKMRQISGVGRTILFVSHNLQAIRNLCQRCLLISDGKLVMDEEPNQVITNYYKRVRSLEIGSDMKPFEPRVRRGSGKVRFSNLRITDQEIGEPRFEFQIGETIRFDIRYQVFEVLEGLYLLIYLKSMSYREWVTGARFSLFEDRVCGGRCGRVVVEFPNNNLRPGDYPLYFRFEDKNAHPYDVIDGLSAPLTIITDKSIDEIGFDPTRAEGFFSIEAKMVGHEGTSDVFGRDESVINDYA